jgi:hypothetical protein
MKICTDMKICSAGNSPHRMSGFGLSGRYLKDVVERTMIGQTGGLVKDAHMITSELQ